VNESVTEKRYSCKVGVKNWAFHREPLFLLNCFICDPNIVTLWNVVRVGQRGMTG